MSDTDDETSAVDAEVKAPPVVLEKVAEDDADGDDADEGDADEDGAEIPSSTHRAGINWTRALAFGVLPAVALLLAIAAGVLKFVDHTASTDVDARTQSVQAAKDITTAILSYAPDTVERQLNDAHGRLTGKFYDKYGALIKDVVIPGATTQQISAVATVPAAASLSVDSGHAVVLLFVDQTVIVGDGAPANSTSSVRVTLEEEDGAWLISEFDPV